MEGLPTERRSLEALLCARHATSRRVASRRVARFGGEHSRRVLVAQRRSRVRGGGVRRRGAQQGGDAGSAAAQRGPTPPSVPAAREGSAPLLPTRGAYGALCGRGGRRGAECGAHAGNQGSGADARDVHHPFFDVSMVRLPPSPLGLYTHFRVWASGRWHCRSVTIIIRIAPNGAPTPQNGPRLCQDVARTSAAKSAGRPPCGALGGCGPARLLLHGRFPVVFILDQSASPHT